MQLSDLRSEVRYRAGVDPYDAMAADAVVTAFINSALRRVANMRDWDWYVERDNLTTVAGTQTYGVPATARNMIRIEGSTDPGLLKLVTPGFAARFSGQTGYPKYWFVQGGSIYLVPTPAKAGLVYTMWYSQQENTLAADSDTPLLPDYAIDLVVIKAALMLAARTDNASQHRLLKDEEREAEASLVDDARRSKGSPTINSRRDWSSQQGVW